MERAPVSPQRSSLPFKFGDERSHRRAKGFGKYANHVDGWHAQASFQHADISAMKSRPGRQLFLTD